MTPDELTAAVAKANEPILARLEALEKVGKSDAGDGGEGVEKLTLEGVGKAVLQIREDVDAVLKARGDRTSVVGQDDVEQVKKSKWAGVF